LIATGHYAPPSLGIQTDDVLSRAIANQLGVMGVAVARVPSQSNAARAGLRGVRVGPRNTVIPGDVIVAVEGKEVSSAALLSARLDDYQIGDAVKLTIWREGKQQEVTVTLQSGDDER
jgi:S1-C subfamily serine protease